MTVRPGSSMRNCYFDASTHSIADLCDGREMGLGRRTRVITRISVLPPHRGKGIGRRLLQEILHDADAEGITLALEIQPSGGLDYDELAAWYSRHGFVDRGGIWFRRPHGRL